MISLSDTTERAHSAYWNRNVPVSTEKHTWFANAYGVYIKKEKYIKNCRKNAFFFSPSAAVQTSSESKILSCAFSMRSRTGPLEAIRAFHTNPPPKSSLEVHVPPSHGKELLPPKATNGSAQPGICLVLVWNRPKRVPGHLWWVFFYIPDLQPSWSTTTLFWPLPPHLAPLQGRRHPKDPRSTPLAPLHLAKGTPESQKPLNLGLEIQTQRVLELASLTPLLQEWGWSCELRSEPGSWV